MTSKHIRRCEYCNNRIPDDAPEKKRFCRKKCRMDSYRKLAGSSIELSNLTYDEIRMLGKWLKHKKYELLQKYEAALGIRKICGGLQLEQIKHWINEHRGEIYGEKNKETTKGSTQRKRNNQGCEAAA